MAISEEQLAFRADRLGSSDALQLMAGAWRAVWEQKTRRATLPDLDLVPSVQIGIATEPLHARFYTHHTGIASRPSEETLVHPDFPFIVANLDFLTWRRAEEESLPCNTLIEAKFHGGSRRDEDLAERYYWQVQHQLLVSGLEHAVLSILRPASYSLVRIARNERDIAALLDTLHAFWWYVENDVEPSDMEGAPPSSAAASRILDMSRHNEFAAWGGILMESHDGMCVYRDAESALKALMPADALIAFLPPAAGAGVVLSRSRDGRLALRLGELPKRHRARAEAWAPLAPAQQQK